MIFSFQRTSDSGAGAGGKTF